MKRILTALLAVCMLLSLAACGPAQTPPPENPDPPAPVEPTPPPPPTQAQQKAAQIETILSGMTTEELVGQLFFARCPETGALEDVTAWHLGGYLLFGQDFKDGDGAWLTKEQVQRTLSAYQTAAREDTGIPLLIGADEEGGTVCRASRNPNLRARPFASPQELFARGGKQAILDETAEKDALLRTLGINVNLAPVADVSTDPQDFIYARAYGQDAASTADYVGRVTAAMADDDMGSVLKHFPGYGSNVDTHTGIAVDHRPEEAFLRSDFLPFEAGIAAGGGTTAVLMSHNIVTAFDETLPASLSPAVYAALRETLHFDGVTMTDDLDMDAVAAYADDGSAVLLALQAGCDLVLTSEYDQQIPLVLSALEEGTLSRERVETACRRVLTWKQALGLLPPITAEN